MKKSLFIKIYSKQFYCLYFSTMHKNYVCLNQVNLELNRENLAIEI